MTPLAAEIFQLWWSNNPAAAIHEMLAVLSEEGIVEYNNLLLGVIKEFYDESENSQGFDFHKELSHLQKRLSVEFEKHKK